MKKLEENNENVITRRRLIKKKIIISSLIGICISILLLIDNLIILLHLNEYGVWGYIGFILLFLLIYILISVTSFFVINIISNRKKLCNNKNEIIFSMGISFIITFLLLFEKFSWFLEIYEISGMLIYFIICLFTFIIISSIIYILIIKLEKRKINK